MFDSEVDTIDIVSLRLWTHICRAHCRDHKALVCHCGSSRVLGVLNVTEIFIHEAGLKQQGQIALKLL